VGRGEDNPMVGAGEIDDLNGSDRDTDGEQTPHVGPSAPDDAIDAGETGAEARSEQRRHTEGS
jgi:hypothetical protein